MNVKEKDLLRLAYVLRAGINHIGSFDPKYISKSDLDDDKQAMLVASNLIAHIKEVVKTKDYDNIIVLTNIKNKE